MRIIVTGPTSRHSFVGFVLHALMCVTILLGTGNDIKYYLRRQCTRMRKGLCRARWKERDTLPPSLFSIEFATDSLPDQSRDDYSFSSPMRVRREAIRYANYVCDKSNLRKTCTA